MFCVKDNKSSTIALDIFYRTEERESEFGSSKQRSTEIHSGILMEFVLVQDCRWGMNIRNHLVNMLLGSRAINE